MLAALPAFTSVSRFPSVKRDLSVVINEDVRVADLIAAVDGVLGAVLNKVELFDVYRGEGVPENAKSVSLSLVLQHADKTMTDDEAEQAMESALNVMQTQFGAQLRS